MYRQNKTAWSSEIDRIHPAAHPVITDLTHGCYLGI
jgi:hypothetical protein